MLCRIAVLAIVWWPRPAPRRGHLAVKAGPSSPRRVRAVSAAMPRGVPPGCPCAAPPGGASGGGRGGIRNRFRRVDPCPRGCPCTSAAPLEEGRDAVRGRHWNRGGRGEVESAAAGRRRDVAVGRVAGAREVSPASSIACRLAGAGVTVRGLTCQPVESALRSIQPAWVARYAMPRRAPPCNADNMYSPSSARGQMAGRTPSSAAWRYSKWGPRACIQTLVLLTRCARLRRYSPLQPA